MKPSRGLVLTRCLHNEVFSTDGPVLTTCIQHISTMHSVYCLVHNNIIRHATDTFVHVCVIAVELYGPIAADITTRITVM